MQSCSTCCTRCGQDIGLKSSCDWYGFHLKHDPNYGRYANHEDPSVRDKFTNPVHDVQGRPPNICGNPDCKKFFKEMYGISNDNNNEGNFTGLLLATEKPILWLLGILFRLYLNKDTRNFLIIYYCIYKYKFIFICVPLLLITYLGFFY